MPSSEIYKYGFCMHVGHVAPVHIYIATAVRMSIIVNCINLSQFPGLLILMNVVYTDTESNLVEGPTRLCMWQSGVALCTLPSVNTKFCIPKGVYPCG